MENGTYTLERLARFTLWDFSETERAHLLERLAALTALPLDQWTPPQAKRLPGNPPVYLLRLDDDWRAFVRVNGGPPYEVEDIVHRERLKFIAEAAGNTKE